MIDSIIFKEIKNTGIIILNRPNSLNALNLEMAELFLDKLNYWRKNNKILRILLIGKGKAFCAGGDIKSMFLSSGKSNLKKNFLNKEYKLNYAISQFPKPYLSIWNGIVMGGGVGLSIYGNKRIATEKSKLAMPETAIGFFPDVGSSYFLSKIPNKFGLYLALTGKVINAQEMLKFSIATDFYHSEDLEEVKENYINQGTLPDLKNLNKLNEINPEFDYEKLNFIKKTFKGNLHNIIKTLKQSDTEFGINTYNSIIKRCPMSLAVTIELIKRAKKYNLKQCLEMDYQLSQKIIYRDDFNKGVEAVLISKTHNPIWNPNLIHDIKNQQIKEYFINHIEKLGL